MINLLPPDNKKDIRAGYANVIIVRYIVLVLVAFGVLAGIVGVAYVTQANLRVTAQERVDNAAENTGAYETTKQEAETFRTNLATAKQILDKELKYSELIIAIAKALPDNVYLDTLSLDAETLGEPVSLTASAKTIKDAQKLKASFEQNSDLFSDVHYESIAPQAQSGEDRSSSAYPIKVSISVTIKKDAL